VNPRDAADGLEIPGFLWQSHVGEAKEVKARHWLFIKRLQLTVLFNRHCGVTSSYHRISLRRPTVVKK